MELVVIFGPPGAGKLTLGRALSDRHGFGLLQGDQPFQALVDVFGWTAPIATRLGREFRHRIIEEAVASDLPGLVMTLVWALDSRHHVADVAGFCELVDSRGGRVLFTELAAQTETRVHRYVGRHAGDRDHDVMRTSMVELDRRHVMNTGRGTTPAHDLLAARPHERIDTTHLSRGLVLGLAEAGLDLCRS